MRFSDGFFKRVEKKTSINKDTILSLAEKLQKGDMQNEETLKGVIDEISSLTGKEVPEDKKDKIIKTIIDDNVPENIEDYI